jgi:hypothetical protein
MGIGPIAVDTRCQGGGVGKLLMEEAAAAASKYVQARPGKGGQPEESLSIRLVVDAWNVAVRVRMAFRYIHVLQANQGCVQTVCVCVCVVLMLVVANPFHNLIS